MNRLSNILLIADAGGDRSTALNHAVVLAKNNQATLTVAAVVEDVFAASASPVPATQLRDSAVSETREKLDEIIKSIEETDIRIKATVLVGEACDEIIRQVLRYEHDLVIKCAEEEHRLRQVLFRSTDIDLMRQCPCLVWITKSTEKPRYQRILAALDHDPEDPVTDALNRQILEMSTSLALSEFSELHIVHAWRLGCESFMRSPRTGLSDAKVDALVERTADERRCWLEDLVTTHGATADKDAVGYLTPQLHLRKGIATQIVPTMAHELGVDLVIIGTVGRIGMSGFLVGNKSENILAQLDCSVLTVKPPGFVSPIAA